MHVPRIARTTFFVAAFLFTIAIASVLLTSRVFADIPHQEAHPFTITPTSHSFSLAAGETATTSFTIGTLGYVSQYTLNKDPSCLKYNEANGNCIEYAADDLLCNYLSLTPTENEDEYNHLDDETDPADAWTLTLTAPCIVGSCPDGYDETYRPPLPRARIGTELSCDVRVDAQPVLAKTDTFGKFATRLSAFMTAYAAADPYYVLHVTATISEASATTTCTEHCYSNVVFLPGIEASRLYRPDYRGGTDQLWLPTTALSDDITQLALTEDGKSINSDIYTKPGDVLDTAGGVSSIYHSFIDTMDTLKENDLIADWEAVPYDWRLSLDDSVTYGNASRFADGRISYIDGPEGATSTPYIEQELKRLAASSRTGKVTIVAHSMGGLVAKRLMQKLGPDASMYVDRIILVASPQVGTPQAVAGLLHGNDQGIPGIVPFIVTERAMRQLGHHAPAAYHLLPALGYFNVVDDPIISIDAAMLPDWVRHYGTTTLTTPAQLDRFLADTYGRTSAGDYDTNRPTTLLPNLLAQSQHAHASLDVWEPPAGIELIQIAGWGIPSTVSGIHYKTEKKFCTDAACTSLPAEVVPEYHFTIDGDGTVVVPSALWTTAAGVKNYWIDIGRWNKDHPISTVGGLLARDHASILHIPELNSFISDIISMSDRPLSSYTYLSTEAPQSTDKRLRYELHSPLSLDLYDDEGRHTGISTTTGRVEEEIPGTYYRQLGDVKYVFADEGSAQHVVMNGYATSTFTFIVGEVRGDTLLATTTFKDVPVTPATNVTLDMSPHATLSPMRIDTNGDGVTDFNLIPKTGDVTTLDTTPPEAIISVDPSTKDLKIEGVDDTSSTTIIKTSSTYIITDAAGNTTTLFFQKTYAGKLLSFAKLTGVQYNGAPVMSIAASSLLYLWNPLTNPPTLLSQTIVVNNTFGIEALYDKKKNKTTVLVKKKGAQIQTQTVTGLRVIKLITNKGVIGYEL